MKLFEYIVFYVFIIYILVLKVCSSIDVGKNFSFCNSRFFLRGSLL